MELPRFITHCIGTVVFRPAAQVFVGLSLLLVTMALPSFPACTGMALVALGATAITAERLGQSPARVPALAAHVTIYAAIYLLFVGATLDAASRHGGPSPLTMLDLALSIWPLAAAAKAVAAAIGHPLTSDL
jgi:hypothetical protein